MAGSRVFSPFFHGGCHPAMEKEEFPSVHIWYMFGTSSLLVFNLALICSLASIHHRICVIVLLRSIKVSIHIIFKSALASKLYYFRQKYASHFCSGCISASF